MSCEILCHQTYDFVSIKCRDSEGLTTTEICKVDKKEGFVKIVLLKDFDEVTVRNSI